MVPTAAARIAVRMRETSGGVGDVDGGTEKCGLLSVRNRGHEIGHRGSFFPGPSRLEAQFEFPVFWRTSHTLERAHGRDDDSVGTNCARRRACRGSAAAAWLRRVTEARCGPDGAR